jgi:hypothetical protein
VGRSYVPIAKADLRRLAELAAEDRRDLFARKSDTGRLYSDRLFAVALCQGGALHFIDGANGVKDLDVWSFYEEHPERAYPYRRIAKVDFGDPKFGITDDSQHFIGRRVDLIGRSIPGADRAHPVETLQRYLRQGSTESARCLAKKAVILLEPAPLLGTVVWPMASRQSA